CISCLELQGYVRPLLELLNGLKKGRFDKGLSSFQQSVAMDRIQRIVGVLQKPHIGEKYLPTLLQIEVMLKLWFPQVTAQVSVTPNPADLSPQNISTHGSSNITPPHKHKDQLHIPVKHKVIRWSGSRLTWVHIAPIFSPPKSGPSHKGGMAKERGSRNVLLPISPLTSRSSPAMQDSFVSSTTPFSEPTRYQCQSVSLGTTSPLQEYAQTPPITMKPSNLVQESTIQT
uniref:Circadian-associated transcriptional repressor-like n=1 Tax=Sinocyclocheilus rhinocerous TaxID=307959 RepID=A0A673NI94_9TELE